MSLETPTGPSLRVALEGCGHGKLHDIYASVGQAAVARGWDGVDLVIIGGDFQAVRNSYDLSAMSVPQKYKAIGDFHEYYSCKRTAPYLTIFIGGNHEASNHLFELYYGGWVAPNIYYLGAANVIRCGPLRIAGLSGIWKGYDYRKPHCERLPYNRDDVQSIYHVRELDVRKLLQVRTQVDLGLSHDWPKRVEYGGNHERLFRWKQGFREDSQEGKLGSTAAKYILDRLRPRYWFSAHLHVKFAASIAHGDYTPGGSPNTSHRASVQDNTSKIPYPYGVDGPTVSLESEPMDKVGNANEEDGSKAITETEADRSAPQNTVPDPSLPLKMEDASEPVIPQSNGPAQNVINQDAAPTSAVGSVSAWQNFHAVAVEHEAMEFQQFLKNRMTPSTVPMPDPETDHQLTWRKVDAGEDSSQRRVTGVRKTGFDQESENKRPKVEQPLNVKNSDEIDLDLSSDAGSSPKEETTIEITGQADTTIKANTSDIVPSGDTDRKEHVPQNLRQQLPASFHKSTPAVYGPLPEAINNKTTHFLALDKCLPGRSFLQLMEFSAISNQDGVQEGRPYCLQYDKEWLAITRVFADHLKLGDPAATTPVDKGDKVYAADIAKEEKWVEEHVVNAGKMTVPENFTMTAPVYDPAVPITTSKMPEEYNNPQTAEFCNLVGIQNKFYLSDEDRQARAAAGPRPNTGWHRGRAGGSGRFGQRNGGRGWNSGGSGHRGRGGRTHGQPSW